MKKLLKVKSVDLMFEKNCPAHHTDEYELVKGGDRPRVLVLRRGEDVEVKVKFSRNYDKDVDDVQVAMQYECE